MEIRYRREMRHNYLVIEPDPLQSESYESRMLLSNRIEGLLHFHMVNIDDKTCFYYEITSKQPLFRLLESRSITRTELSGLILAIAATLERMEGYLLPEEQILLEPEYIYVEPESFRVSFCLLPGSQRNFPLAVGQLLQFLLGNVDHQDKECVVLIYGLYQESQRENYGMEDLLKLLDRPAGDMSSRQNETEINSATNHRTPEKIGNLTEPKSIQATHKSTGWKGWRKKIFSTKEHPQKRQVNTPETWQAFFEEAEETVLRKQELSKQEPITTLLTETKKADSNYYLQAMQPGIEDILITEFPFIIGKQSSLADFVLEKETVSRLHAKIDQGTGSFHITDLNSTNGTMVRGRLLENNETETICIGDEVQIAEWKYRFVAGSRG